jgi:hypothetical protein
MDTKDLTLAELEGCSPEYKVAMPIESYQLLVDRDVLSARVICRSALGQKHSRCGACKVPGVEELGLNASEGDILLRKPPVLMKHPLYL